MDEDCVEISMSTDVQEIASLAARIDEFCESRGIGPMIANAVNVSLDELLTNTIDYGYDDEGLHQIGIVLSRQADKLVVEIDDDSRAFDPSGSPPEVDLDAPLEDRPIGGLGLFLVHELMDSVDYRRTDGRNVVTLKKHLID